MGIDSQRLLHGQPGDFFCSICHDLVNPEGALQAPCCHFWCQDCIVGAIASGQTLCPDDRSQVVSGSTLRPLKAQNSLVYRMLLKVKVKCTNYEKGCPWQGDLSEAATHEASCIHACQGCKANYLMKLEGEQLRKHMQERYMRHVRVMEQKHNEDIRVLVSVGVAFASVLLYHVHILQSEGAGRR
eukprot:jgi/Mesen1/2256/ME000153S01482